MIVVNGRIQDFLLGRGRGADPVGATSKTTANDCFSIFYRCIKYPANRSNPTCSCGYSSFCRMETRPIVLCLSTGRAVINLQPFTSLFNHRLIFRRWGSLKRQFLCKCCLRAENYWVQRQKVIKSCCLLFLNIFFFIFK